MKYIQVGEIGKAVLVSTKSDLPTAGIAYLNKFYVATDTNTIYTCKPEGSGYAWKVAAVLPALTNGIAAPTQLQEGVEAIDADGHKVTGTMKFVEKTANANGTYYPNDDYAQGYSKFIVDVAGETTENPYIATTDAEMKAYLAEEYVGSFVRFENARYRNITLPYSLSTNLGNMASTTGAFDTYLGQSRMNKYIDNWTKTDNNKLILSTDGTFSQNDISQTEKTNYHYIVIYMLISIKTVMVHIVEHWFIQFMCRETPVLINFYLHLFMWMAILKMIPYFLHIMILYLEVVYKFNLR